ncbi:MAG: VCBS repeat-containing protein, partial [Acidobacteriota bacterium]|nr:VCBS repeat-containing protein [Acidobacteriota bacterium]
GHSGLAVGDVDGDGLDDLYVLQQGGLPNRLYIQNPDGSASDRSEWSRLDWLDRSLSALIVDLDGDGDQDLVVGTTAGLLLLANDGKGRFEVRASQTSVRYGYSLAASDYDRDGDLDLYVSRYSPLTEDPVEAALDIPKPIPYHDAQNGAPNFLLRNDGEWLFTDATVETGMDDDNRRWSFAAAWEDFDNDGDPDLYVANDFGRNCLYRNDGGRFTNVAAAAGVEDVGSGMSVAWADYDQDGLMDLYVGNMFSSAGNRIATQPRFQSEADESVRTMLLRLAKGNTLFRNLGDGRFAEVSDEAAVTMGRWAWSSVFADINNDGTQDLVVSNGYLTGENPDDL